MADVSLSRKHAQKGEGFPGQRIVVLPRSVVACAEKHRLMAGLLPTDVGFFPNAAGHLRERVCGVNQAIFIYCLKGGGWCRIAGRHHAVDTGDLLVIPPEVPHAYGANESRPWSIHWFHAKGLLLDSFLRELEVTVDRPVARVGADGQMLALFDELLEVVRHGYPTHQMLCAAHTLAHLMTVIIRERLGAHHERPDAQQRISQTIDYMRQHLNQALKLDGLAAMAALSRSRYVELFRQQTGYAPIDYFIRLRMHRACQLLDTTGFSVKQIASLLGYSDPLYFSRVFRGVNDSTPTEYRKLHKG